MKLPKEGALNVGERDVLSIFIRARERDAHFTPPLLAASLIFQTLCVTSEVGTQLKKAKSLQENDNSTDY